MTQVKICYRNILENSTVAVTSENASFPKYRLHDRDIGKLFKGASTPANFYITLDQGAVISYEVNRLFIPGGHNLNGLTVKLQYSTDNFSGDINDAASWVQAGSGLIDQSFGVQTKRYWRLNIAAPAAAPELSEMFLGKAYTFEINPLVGAREARARNISKSKTSSGLTRAVKLGEKRRRRSYDLRDLRSAQKTEFEAWESLCDGIKGLYVEDHLGNVMFMEKINEEDFGYDTEDETGAYYSCHLDLEELLGAV